VKAAKAGWQIKAMALAVFFGRGHGLTVISRFWVKAGCLFGLKIQFL
jgi:hypothetical protein